MRSFDFSLGTIDVSAMLDDATLAEHHAIEVESQFPALSTLEGYARREFYQIMKTLVQTHPCEIGRLTAHALENGLFYLSAHGRDNGEWMVEDFRLFELIDEQVPRAALIWVCNPSGQYRLPSAEVPVLYPLHDVSRRDLAEGTVGMHLYSPHDSRAQVPLETLMEKLRRFDIATYRHVSTRVPRT